MDSCHTSDDPNKCTEPVPDSIEEKFLRNTYTDNNSINATYKWTVKEEFIDEIKINNGSTNKIFKIAMDKNGISESIQIEFVYSE